MGDVDPLQAQAQRRRAGTRRAEPPAEELLQPTGLRLVTQGARSRPVEP
jgi:hypothetical protein